MNELIENTELEMQGAIETLEKRLLNIRAGRANPSILDGVMIVYYGTPTPLKQLANISIPEARQLMIKPFDKSILQAIEKGIYEANIGLTPNNNGEVIILNIPALTEGNFWGCDQGACRSGTGEIRCLNIDSRETETIFGCSRWVGFCLFQVDGGGREVSRIES